VTSNNIHTISCCVADLFLSRTITRGGRPRKWFKADVTNASLTKLHQAHNTPLNVDVMDNGNFDGSREG